MWQEWFLPLRCLITRTKVCSMACERWGVVETRSWKKLRMRTATLCSVHLWVNRSSWQYPHHPLLLLSLLSFWGNLGVTTDDTVCCYQNVQWLTICPDFRNTGEVSCTYMLAISCTRCPLWSPRSLFTVQYCCPRFKEYLLLSYVQKVE